MHIHCISIAALALSACAIYDKPTYNEGIGWYLRGLPALAPTDILPEPERGSDEWKSWNAVHRMPPGPERTRLRSRSFPGMMRAAATQWAGAATDAVTAKQGG